MLCVYSPSLNYVQRYVTLFYVHSTPQRFENGALFLRLSLPSMLMRHENSALFLRVRATVYTIPSRKRNFIHTAIRATVTIIRHETGALFIRPLGLLSQ